MRKIGSRYVGLIDYWDAGYVTLDLTTPEAPVFMDDSTYPSPDPFSGLQFPEGNGHQAEFSKCPDEPLVNAATGCASMPRYILGADEDFNPFRLVVRYTSGNFNGQDVTTGEGDATPPITPGNPVNGPSYYGGRACTPASVPLAPSPNAIAVVERGDPARSP